MKDILSQSFGINSAWFFKNGYDLQKNSNEDFPLPNQASWTVFSPSRTLGMKVILILWMENFEMGKWLQLKKEENMLEKLDHVCPTFWVGTFVTGCLVPANSSMPHRFYSLSTLRPTWYRQKSRSLNSL